MDPLLLSLISTLSLEEIYLVSEEDDAWRAVAEESYLFPVELEHEVVDVETDIDEDCFLPEFGCIVLPEGRREQMKIGTTNIRASDRVIGRVYTTAPNAVYAHWTERWVFDRAEDFSRFYTGELVAEYERPGIVGWVQDVARMVNNDPVVANAVAAELHFNYFGMPSASAISSASFSSFTLTEDYLFRVENILSNGTPKDSVEQGWLYRTKITNNLTGETQWMDHWVLKTDYEPPGTSNYSMRMEPVSNPYASLQDFLQDQVSQQPPLELWRYVPIVYAFDSLPVVAF